MKKRPVPRKKVLILGNSPYINQIKFDLLDPNVITVGVNRIWHVYNPNYFFFHDYEILDELRNHREEFQQLRKDSTFISSDWLKYRARKGNRMIPSYIKVHKRVNPRQFPDSVTTALQIMGTYYLPKQYYSFYVAGVSLRWQEPSHFWKEKKETSNNNGKKWYSPRFERMMENWRQMQTQNYNIYSVEPGSRLNRRFRYVKIENLYK